MSSWSENRGFASMFTSAFNNLYYAPITVCSLAVYSFKTDLLLSLFSYVYYCTNFVVNKICENVWCKFEI